MTGAAERLRRFIVRGFDAVTEEFRSNRAPSSALLRWYRDAAELDPAPPRLAPEAVDLVRRLAERLDELVSPDDGTPASPADCDLLREATLFIHANRREQ